MIALPVLLFLENPRALFAQPSLQRDNEWATALIAHAGALLWRVAVDLALDGEQHIDALDRLDRDRRWLMRARSKNLPGAPGESLLTKPSGPCSLNLITQCRSVWRSMPPAFAASARDAPVEHRRDRQEPPRLSRILPALGQQPKRRARIVRP